MSKEAKRKLNILLADDDDLFWLLVEKCLDEPPSMFETCRLSCVSDGGEAVNYVLGRGRYVDRDEFPPPDVILLDERMVRMDGSEALVEIKSNHAGQLIPVCMFSTSRPEKWMRLCYGRGAAFCIEKPMGFESLRDKVRLIVEFSTKVLELPATQ